MRSFGLFLIAGLMAACGESTQSPAPARLYSVQQGSLVDGDGHALFLRGINVREDAKHIPEHIIPLTQAQVSLIGKHFNSVRLLTHWEALVPEQGQVDQLYLDGYVAEVDKLAAAGLYVIIDMHQDLWGSPFSNGGAEWTCPEEIRAGYEPTSPWWLNYNSDQVRGCFDRFWSDGDAIQAEWLFAWTSLAQAVCHQERVIGFDLFNEPWPGSGLGDTAWDQDVLYPFYQRAIAAIEAVCPERVFFLEPSGAFNVGLADAMALRADDLARVVIAPHFYPQEVHEDGLQYTKTQPELEAALESALGAYLNDGSPDWVGEYGGLSQNPGFSDYLVHISRVYYERFIGSALWAFNTGDGGFAWLNEAGQLKPEFAAAWSVPLLTRIPNRPTRLAPDFETGSLVVEFACEKDRLLEVLLPSAGAWSLDMEPGGVLELSEQVDRRLNLTCTGSRQVSLSISP